MSITWTLAYLQNLSLVAQLPRLMQCIEQRPQLVPRPLGNGTVGVQLETQTPTTDTRHEQ